MKFEGVELVYLPQDNDKCRIVVKSAKKNIFVNATTKIKKANEYLIST